MGNNCFGSSLKSLRNEIGYYNYTGTMIKHYQLSTHNADDEYTFVTSHDKSIFEAGEECYLIHSEWLSSWLKFASEENNDPFPKVPITNGRLMQGDGKAILGSILPKKDFRPVSKAVWEFLFSQYGGGPVISFLVPEGLKAANYADGTWIKRVKVQDIVSIAFPVDVQQLSRGGEIALQATLRYHSFGSSNPLVLSDNELLAVEAFAKNRTASMLNKESQKLAAEADLATKQGVALMFAGKDANFDEAVMLNEKSKAMEDQADAAVLEGAMAMFQDKDDSKKHREEAVLLSQQADALQQEAGVATTEIVAQHLLSGLSTTLKNDAKDAKTEQLVEAEAEVIAVMLQGSAKNQFATARRLGRLPDMERAAALMLQNAWRGKLAKRRAQLLKEKRIRLLEEAYARKLQSRYRAHLAKRKVEQMKEEVRRLRLLAQTKAALAIQSSWRRKLARRKMLAAAALRAESRRLRALAMEKAATAIQCSWRKKIARRKLQKAAELRRESLRLLAEARHKAALTIQCAWRWSKSVHHVELRVIRSAAARVIWRRWRTVVLARTARKAFIAMQLSKLRVFSIQLHHAHNILISDVISSSSDPYVFVHGEKSDDMDIGSRRPSASKARPPSIQGTSPTLCCYRSKIIKKNLNPVWNEKCLLAGLTCKESLMLTIMDKDTFSKDDCLGQVVVPLSRYPQLARNEEISLSDVTVEALGTSVYDAKGKELTTSVAALPTNSKDPAAQLRGTISFSIRLNSLYRSHSGWVTKKAKGIITSYKYRFMVLDDSGHLSYFEDSHTLDHPCPRGLIDCKNINRISLYLQHGLGYDIGSPSAHGHEAGGSKIVLDMKINGESEDWVILWPYDSVAGANVAKIDEGIAVWLRKIQYCCAKGVTVNQATGSLVKRLEELSKVPLAEPQGGSATKKKGGYLFG